MCYNVSTVRLSYEYLSVLTVSFFRYLSQIRELAVIKWEGTKYSNYMNFMKVSSFDVRD